MAQEEMGSLHNQVMLALTSILWTKMLIQSPIVQGEVKTWSLFTFLCYTLQDTKKKENFVLQHGMSFEALKL